jgi:hypothetical protein
MRRLRAEGDDFKAGSSSSGLRFELSLAVYSRSLHHCMLMLIAGRRVP